MSQENENPQALLDEVRRSQDLVRARVATSSWRYDLLYSSVAALMVAGQAAPLPFNVLASGGAAMAFGLMWRNWSEKAGVAVTGFSPKRARWAAIGLGVVLMILMLAAVYCGRTGQIVWVAPLALIAFVAAWSGSWLWAKLYNAGTADRP